MKLVSKAGVELDVKKYPMPVKSASSGTVTINGESVDTKVTSGRGKEYTYFRIKNVDLYVPGVLADDDSYTLDLPEDFGSDTEPAERKSYYVRKRPLNPDGSVPAGSSDATGAAHTEVKTHSDGRPLNVGVNEDGSLVDPKLQEQTLLEGNDGALKNESVNQEDIDAGHATAAQLGAQGSTTDGDTDPSGAAIDETATQDVVKKRSKRTDNPLGVTSKK